MSGWIPICKALARELPHDRPFTRIEAMISLTLDYDNGEPSTIKGYASLWRWSRGKVERFLDEVGARIEYPEDTGQKQNQRGQIMIQITSRKRADNGQIKIVDSKWLESEAGRKQADNEQKAGRSQGTTKDPDPKPINKPSPAKNPPAGRGNGGEGFYLTKRKRKLAGKNLETFNQFWETFNYKHGKAEAADAWLDIPMPTDKIVADIIRAATAEAMRRPGLIAEKRTPIYPQGWLSGRRWEDEAYQQPPPDGGNEAYLRKIGAIE